MTFKDTKKRTGRTFRMLLRALLEASEGNRVCVVAYRTDYARDLRARAINMATGYIEANDGGDLLIGNGLIRFSGPIDRQEKRIQLLGQKFLILHDHYSGIGNRV